MVKKVLDNHVPIKKKTIRANNGPFMTKALRKAIMQRSKLRNKYNKERSEENLRAFKRKRNECVKLLCNVKLEYYKNLDLNDLFDNRKFWKAVKPFFSGKAQTNAGITLFKNVQVISDDSKIANILNEFFVDITVHSN